jgi:hypothetical protein
MCRSLQTWAGQLRSAHEQDSHDAPALTERDANFKRPMGDHQNPSHKHVRVRRAEASLEPFEATAKQSSDTPQIAPRTGNEGNVMAMYGLTRIGHLNEQSQRVQRFVVKRQTARSGLDRSCHSSAGVPPVAIWGCRTTRARRPRYHGGSAKRYPHFPALRLAAGQIPPSPLPCLQFAVGVDGGQHDTLHLEGSAPAKPNVFLYQAAVRLEPPPPRIHQMNCGRALHS